MSRRETRGERSATSGCLLHHSGGRRRQRRHEKPRRKLRRGTRATAEPSAIDEEKNRIVRRVSFICARGRGSRERSDAARKPKFSSAKPGDEENAGTTDDGNESIHGFFSTVQRRLGIRGPRPTLRRHERIVLRSLCSESAGLK